jgi:hypothetical protein
VIKYEVPKGIHIRLDCPPPCLPGMSDPRVPLWITESQRKGDALASRGLRAIALLGVWNWRGRNDAGGVTTLGDWDDIALRDDLWVLGLVHLSERETEVNGRARLVGRNPEAAAGALGDGALAGPSWRARPVGATGGPLRQLPGRAGRAGVRRHDDARDLSPAEVRGG